MYECMHLSGLLEGVLKGSHKSEVFASNSKLQYPISAIQVPRPKPKPSSHEGIKKAAVVVHALVTSASTMQLRAGRRPGKKYVQYLVLIVNLQRTRTIIVYCNSQSPPYVALTQVS